MFATGQLAESAFRPGNRWKPNAVKLQAPAAPLLTARRVRGAGPPSASHQVDRREHTCLGGEGAEEERPSSSSLLFISLPEIDDLGKSFHRLRAGVKVRR